MLLASTILSFGTFAASTSEDSENSANKNSLAEVEAAIESGDYQRATDILESLKGAKSSNADVFNLLGYAQRKLGRVDTAFKYYRQALALNPEHRGANQYLGELYLETDQLPRAQEHLKVLNGVFFPCDEYSELKQAIEAYQAKRS